MSLYERIMARGESPYAAPEPEEPPADLAAELTADRSRRCAPCDVTWHGGPSCWNCGAPATET